MNLPIDDFIAQIQAIVRERNQIILMAEPGAGKTTRLPPQLLDAVKGKIAVLEPRRMAAIAASQFIAEENRWELGREVGYQVRNESRFKEATRLLFMTDAILLRRLIYDPELSEFDLIIIDEFHERNLNQDVILGLLKELQQMGRDIKILVMSATLNRERLEDYLNESQTVAVPGKSFPLEIRHSTQGQAVKTDPDFIDHVVDCIMSSDHAASGDILVFLPGVGEINRVQNRLLEKNFRRPIFPLHGAMKLEDQRQVLLPHSEKRVILATNIAEASVTVPGVNWVIDSGLARTQTVNLASGFSQLGLTKIGKFNATQRAGRAARQSPGTCLRLWTTFDDAAQIQEMVPEVQRTDLMGTLLYLAHCGVRDFANFQWFDRPPTILLSKATQSLQSLGALTGDNELTPLGHELLQYPLEPRWGILLELSKRHGCPDLGAQLAALLQEQDFINDRGTNTGDESDLTQRLQALAQALAGRRVPDVHPVRLDSVVKLYQQLKRSTKGASEKQSHRDQVIELLLLSQGDRLCRRRGDSDRGLMVGGRGVKLSPNSQVKTSEFFIALNGVDLQGSSETLVSMACGMTKAELLKVLGEQITENSQIQFDEKRGQFISRRVRRWRDLEIEEPQLVPLDEKDLGGKWVDLLRARWSEILVKNKSLNQWMLRWRFFAQGDAEKLTMVSLEQMEPLFALVAPQLKDFNDIETFNWVSYIEGTIERGLLQQFHSTCPASFQAPSGVRHDIQYEESNDSQRVFVEIRLQELFGLQQTPQLGLHKAPLVFKLLAPNFRPVQVTADISGFWKKSYFEVRKELRARYPKHPWPEDPLTALPVAKGRRR